MKQHLKHIFGSTTARLATTYLAIIMLMSIGFSVVFYNTSSRALDRQVPPDGFSYHEQKLAGSNPDPQNSTASAKSATDPADQQSTAELRTFLQKRTREGQHDLMVRLIIVNATALILGGAISYALARRTLQPIEANMEAQRQFVSDASHELRTPLTAIQTSNDVTLRNKKLTLAQAKEVIRDNTAEVVKLKQLSDALLDLAKNDKHQQKLATVSVQSAVQDALTSVVAMAQQKDIAVDDATANITVLSNKQVLSQLLVILIDNAIKYSPNGTTVHISTAVKGNSVLLSVRDEGVGIRASDIPHLFRRFYRADSARNDSHSQGYGLGLAIASSLARAHGAQILVESEIRKGSTFTIKLQIVK